MALRMLRAIPPGTWFAGFFLLLVFLTGGSSRAETASLVILRPLAAMAAILFLARLGRSDWRTLRAPAILACVAVAGTALQLVPLPPAIWSALPGRAILTEAAKLTGQDASWRSFSMVPWRTMNALLFWLIPVAAAAAAAAGDARHRYRLLVLVIVLGLVSGMLGIFQTLGPMGGGLYLYANTAQGSAAGLFGNRNHQALLLATMFPLFAAFACDRIRTVEEQRRRIWMAIAAGAALVPLVLIVGSRAGVVLLAIGVASIAFVYRSPAIGQPAKRGVRKYNPLTVGISVGFVALIAISALLSRATSLTRLAASGLEDDVRSQVWMRSAMLAGKFFPTGAGFGTFVETYQLDEPRSILRLTYANHVHNDWLEVVIGGGLFGLALLLAAVALWAIGSWRLWQSRRRGGPDQVAGRAGASILLMAGVASILDYPVRTPLIAALCALATVWMAYAVNGRYRDELAQQR